MTRVLHIHGGSAELDLTRKHLSSRIQALEYTGATDAQEFLTHPEEISSYNCVLSSNLELPGAMRKAGITTPVIYLSPGLADGEARRAIDEGADLIFRLIDEDAAWTGLALAVEHLSSECRGWRDSEHRSADRCDEYHMLHTLVHVSPNIVCLKDSDCRWLEMNREGVRFWGVTKEQFYGKTGLDLAREYPKREKAFLTSYDSDLEVWERGTTIREVQQFIGPDGEQKHYQVIKVPTYNDDGSRKGLVLVATDITHLKNMEIALAESESFYRSLFERTEEGFFLHDLEGSILRVNPEFRRLMETTEREIVGRSVFDFVHADYQEVARDCFNELLEHGATRFSGKVKTVKGNAFFGEVFIHVIELNGERQFAFGLIRDITDKIKQEEELLKSRKKIERRNSDLEKLNDQLESFTYTVSHDLKAPLRHIKGYSQVLEMLSRESDYEDIPDVVSHIRESVERLDRMIESTLQLHRTASGAISKVRVDISECAGEIAEELRSQEPERKAEFVIQPGIVAWADKQLIRVVLQNLLENAWKYSHDKKMSKIQVSASESRGRLHCTVSDNGSGFNQKYSNDVFLPFKRFHDDPLFSGSGIGLATVKKIIDRHHGKVWAESKKGEGTRISFSLEAYNNQK